MRSNTTALRPIKPLTDRVTAPRLSTSWLQLAVGLVTKGLPCLRLFSDDKEEVKVYEMFADAFMPMQVVKTSRSS